MANTSKPNDGAATGATGGVHTGEPDAPDHVDSADTSKADSYGARMEKRFMAMERAVIDGLYGGNRRNYEEAHGIDTSESDD